MLDACYNNDKKMNICPIDEFLTVPVIQMAKDLLKKTGEMKRLEPYFV